MENKLNLMPSLVVFLSSLVNNIIHILFSTITYHGCSRDFLSINFDLGKV